jgi:hypothetical protein
MKDAKSRQPVRRTKARIFVTISASGGRHRWKVLDRQLGDKLFSFLF